MTARTLSVVVMASRLLEHRWVIDATGRIELQVEPLAVGTLAAAELCQPDVIVMDASSSFPSFIQLFRSARTLERLDHVPIVAWFERADPERIAQSIDAGVDDCLTTRIDSPESVARLHAAGRRAVSQPHHSKIRFADLILDTASLKLWRTGRMIPLTVFQLRLLEFLMTHPGEVFSRRQLLEQVWGKESTDEGAVTACVARIRRALGEGLIRSVRGAGYSLDDDVSDLTRAASHDSAPIFKL
ncbi:MAG: response regulator transcription factor [Chloroflexota bacterium]|nr:response regulator transcription factor [Chloroflexota bacterium]